MSALPYTDAPVDAKIRAERLLLGAMLRECHQMPQVIAGLNVVALSNASDGMAKVFLEILKQFNETGKYTPSSVSRKTGFKDLAHLAALEPETDLPMALDWWWTTYQQWAQKQAYAGAIQGSHFDAMSMREAVAKSEADLGLNWTQVKGNAKQDFEKWGIDKIEGRTVVSNMRSPIRAMHDFFEYFEKGYVTVISGDTSMGKSQLAYGLFSSFCDQGARGIFNSGEMPEVDGYKRLLGIRHGINPKGAWLEKDFPTIAAALKEVSTLPNDIVKIFGFSEIEAACVAMSFNGGIDFLFIDLLKYVTLVMAKGASREESLSTLTAAFITLAGRMNIHIFLVHHLNGDLGKRGGSKRPILDDLRDSKAIKQDVANVIFCYRPVYYGITEDENGNSLLIKDRFGNVIGDKAELIIAKNRNGDLGTANVKWSPIRGYRDLDDYEPPPVTPKQMSRKEPDDSLPF